MNHSNRSSIATILLLLLLSFPFPSAHATEYYAFRLAGSDCTLCHTDPKTGSLNQTGTAFQEGGYQYPLVWKEVLFYFLGALVLTIIAFGLRRRYRLWCLGKKEEKWGRLRKRWRGLLIYGLGNGNVLKNPFPGISHLLLFGAFLLLGLAVLAMMSQEYLLLPLMKTRFFNSESYPYLRLFLDLSGILGFVGTISLALRRYIQRPRGLDHQRTDAISLFLLFLVFLTGFSVTGIRNGYNDSSYSQWAPAASTMASLSSHLAGEQKDLKTWLSVLWWVHYLLSLALLSYIPFSRLLHLFSSPLSIFFRNLEPKGALARIDLESSETYGVEKIEEFTRKHLLELDACTRCGRCQENCPAFLSEKALNPKKVVQTLKRHMEKSPAEREGIALIGEVVTEEEIWQCTTCRNCLEHCPVFIEPMAKLMAFRRNLALGQGRIPKEAQFAFRNIERKGNPWGFDLGKRMWWTKELKVKEVSPGDEVDILYWVGCYGSYDDRNISVATSLIRVLNRAGLDFGVLGRTEWCCGIDLRRMGNEYLYQVTAEKNITQLRQIKFNKILTSCPHCLNTLRNEYPQFGGQFEVIHYTELLDPLIREGKIVLSPGNGAREVTYHDSCYLGRYNDGFEAPRKILGAIDGHSLVEMERSHEKSFCCGGGGCHMWMEEKAGKRINQMRVEMAEKTGAEILATVCPLCMISLDSAVKVLNLDDKLRVMDILELVSERLKPD